MTWLYKRREGISLDKKLLEGKDYATYHYLQHLEQFWPQEALYENLLAFLKKAGGGRRPAAWGWGGADFRSSFLFISSSEIAPNHLSLPSRGKLSAPS